MANENLTYNQQKAIQYHSITFVDGNHQKNTWLNWYLIPTTRPVVSLPPINEKYVEIPGRSGSIDLTNYLTGAPTYANRRGAWEFYFIFDECRKRGKDWRDKIEEINSYLYGQEHTIVLDDDPRYSYTGKFKVSWKPQQRDYTIVAIEYNLEPEKTQISNGDISYT